jgi:hypothetical protein
MRVLLHVLPLESVRTELVRFDRIAPFRAAEQLADASVCSEGGFNPHHVATA